MFLSVELRAYCHATEDEERVRGAFATLHPEAKPKTTTLEGHYGNPILLMAVRIDRPIEIDAFWKRCREANVLRSVLDDLPERIDDDGVLHFRVDKQKAYIGRIELAMDGDVIAVKAKVSTHPARRSEILRAARDYLSRV